MKERYVGVKFKTVFLNEDSIFRKFSKEINSLLNVARILKRHDLVKKNYGNISLRVEGGFLIKRAGVSLGKLKPSYFVLVKKCSKDRVYCVGKFDPSSEARMHCLIYKTRKDINCILHVHDLLVVKKYSSLKDIGVVENYPYGTLELARGVAKALRNCNYVVIRGHGIVAIGKDIDQALGLVMKNREAIQSKKIKYSKDD